jgi:hypothetical protein
MSVKFSARALHCCTATAKWHGNTAHNNGADTPTSSIPSSVVLLLAKQSQTQERQLQAKALPILDTVATKSANQQLAVTRQKFIRVNKQRNESMNHEFLWVTSQHSIVFWALSWSWAANGSNPTSHSCPSPRCTTSHDETVRQDFQARWLLASAHTWYRSNSMRSRRKRAAVAAAPEEDEQQQQQLQQRGDTRQVEPRAPASKRACRNRSSQEPTTSDKHHLPPRAPTRAARTPASAQPSTAGAAPVSEDRTAGRATVSPSSQRTLHKRSSPGGTVEAPLPEVVGRPAQPSPPPDSKKEQQAEQQQGNRETMARRGGAGAGEDVSAVPNAIHHASSGRVRVVQRAVRPSC